MGSEKLFELRRRTFDTPQFRGIEFHRGRSQVDPQQGPGQLPPIQLDDQSHLRPKVREVYIEWLAETYPDLVPRYEAMYPKAYASKEDQGHLGARFTRILESLGGIRKRRPRHRGARKPDRPPRRADQLTLL